MMDQAEVIQKVKERLERDGYEVWTSRDGRGVGPDIFAMRNHDELVIEAVGETKTRSCSGQDIIISLGTIVKRIKEGATETRYGIAIPESFMRFLKEFEVGGLQALKLHLFIVQEFGLVYHLGFQKTVELVQRLKAGEHIVPFLIDIDYKPETSKP